MGKHIFRDTVANCEPPSRNTHLSIYVYICVYTFHMLDEILNLEKFSYSGERSLRFEFEQNFNK